MEIKIWIARDDVPQDAGFTCVFFSKPVQLNLKRGGVFWYDPMIDDQTDGRCPVIADFFPTVKKGEVVEAIISIK